MSIKKMLEPLLEVLYAAIVGFAMAIPFAFIIIKGCQISMHNIEDSMRHIDSRNNERLDRMERRLQALELQRGDTAK